MLKTILTPDVFAAAPEALPQLPGGSAPASLPQLPRLPGQESLPHGIKGLAEYPFTISPALLVGLLSLILISGILLFWWLRKRKQAETACEESKADPLKELQDAIFTLVPADPFTGKAAEDYFFSLGFHFRGIIEHCCGFPATDLTIKELKHPLMNISALEQQEKHKILEFLLRSDMIKFAESPTGLSEAEKYHSEVKNWVITLVRFHKQSEFSQNSEISNQ